MKEKEKGILGKGKGMYPTGVNHILKKADSLINNGIGDVRTKPLSTRSRDLNYQAKLELNLIHFCESDNWAKRNYF